MVEEIFKRISVDSADPYTGGIQYGEQVKKLIYRGIEDYQRHFSKTLQMDWSSITTRNSLYLDLLEWDFLDELEEVRGIADGSGTKLEEILALNHRYEILKYKIQECAIGAVLPAASVDGQSTYPMQNWDYHPWVERHAVVVSIDNGAGLHIVGVTEAGQLVRNRMNNFGTGLRTNNLTSVFDTGEVSVPVTPVRREAPNGRSFEEVCENVRNNKREVSCNFMLASAKGVGVDLEITPDGVLKVFPENNIVTHANYMVARHAFCINQDTKFRDEVLRRRLEKCSGQLDIYRIQQCLKGHETFPGAPDTYPEGSCIEAVCSHVPHGDYDEDKVRKTISLSAYDLSGRTVYTCKGCPCEGTYISYKV